jgi:hypothetical protein
VIILIVPDVLAIAAGIIYLAEPAKSLPAFFPGPHCPPDPTASRASSPGAAPHHRSDTARAGQRSSRCQKRGKGSD